MKNNSGICLKLRAVIISRHNREKNISFSFQPVYFSFLEKVVKLNKILVIYNNLEVDLNNLFFYCRSRKWCG